MSSDGPAVPISGELVSSPARTLFATDDPVEVLDHARRLADALKTALDQGGMTLKIGRREHVLIDGWQTLGAMLGVSPYVVWTKPYPGADESGDGWEARAEARTIDGRVISSAEAMVTRAERNWKDSDEYALRSMAQTRAMSKALRGPLGFVVTLAGRSATPAEEVSAHADIELPDWAEAVDAEGQAGVELELRALLEAAGIEPASRRAHQIVQRIQGDCEGEIPVCIAKLTARLVWAITSTNSEENTR